MGILSRLFGFSESVSNETTTVSHYPDGITIDPSISPLIRHSEICLAPALKHLGLAIDPASCMSLATNCLADSSSTSDYWEKLVAACRDKLGTQSSRPISLAHILWAVTVPIEAPPRFSSSSCEQEEEFVASQIEKLLRQSSITINRRTSGTNIGGSFGQIGFNLFLKVKKRYTNSLMVELEANTYLGRFQLPENDDGVVATLCINDSIADAPIAFFLDEGSLQGTLIFVFPFQDIADPSMLSRWLILFETLLSKSYGLSTWLAKNHPFTFYERQFHNPDKLVFAHVEQHNQALQGRSTKANTRQSITDMNAGPVNYLIVQGTRYFMQWGDDLCPVQFDGEKCSLTIPFREEFAPLVKLALSLNRWQGNEESIGNFCQSFMVGGAWSVQHDDELGGSILKEWNLVFQTHVDTSDLNVLKSVIDGFRVRLRQLANQIMTDRCQSYIAIWKKQNVADSSSIRSSLYGDDYLHITRTEDDQAAWEKMREEREKLMKRRESIVMRARLGLYSGKFRDVAVSLQEAESLATGNDIQLIRALAAICEGRNEDALADIAPMFNANNLHAIVLAGFAHCIIGDSAEGNRYFKRSADLLLG